MAIEKSASSKKVNLKFSSPQNTGVVTPSHLQKAVTIVTIIGNALNAKIKIKQGNRKRNIHKLSFFFAITNYPFKFYLEAFAAAASIESITSCADIEPETNPGIAV